MYTAAPTSNAFPPLQRLEWPANELQKSSSSVDLADAPRCVNADMPFTHLKITDITWNSRHIYAYMFISSLLRRPGSITRTKNFMSTSQTTRTRQIRRPVFCGLIWVDTSHLRTISPCSELVKPVYSGGNLWKLGHGNNQQSVSSLVTHPDHNLWGWVEHVNGLNSSNLVSLGKWYTLAFCLPVYLNFW